MADDKTKTDADAVTTDGGSAEGDAKSSQVTDGQLKELQTQIDTMKTEKEEADKEKLMREMEIEQLRKMGEKSDGTVTQDTETSMLDSELGDLMITDSEKAIKLIEERTKKAIFEDDKFKKLTSRQDEIDRMRREQGVAAEAIKKMGLEPNKELSENAPAIEEIWRTAGKDISVLDAYNRVKIDKGEFKVADMRAEHELEGAGGVTDTGDIERSLTTEEESWFTVAKIEHDKARKEGEPEFTRKQFAKNLDKRYKEEGLIR